MSDHYKALTRKYRPRTFEDIVSQGHVSNTLRNAIQEGRLAHAYLFCGPRGVGKTTMARVLARTINGIEEEVDGEAITQNLNIIEIDAASNNSVDDVRMLRDTVIVPPPPGQSKVYIIDEVHMLSKQAFNALLKTLEEPPPYVVFIFATTEPHKILPTILSRCQRFDFRRISIDEIISRLRHICSLEGIQIDEESLHHIARKADGALRDALGLLDQVIAFCGLTITAEAMMKALNIVSTERLFELMDIVHAHDAGAGMSLLDSLLAEGYDIQEFLVELLGHLRNLFVAREVNQLHLIEATDDTRERYKQQSAQFSADDLMRMLHIVLAAQTQVREAQQPRVQIEIALLKLVTMERSEGIQALLKEVAALKQMLANGGGLPAAEDAARPSSASSGVSARQRPAAESRPSPPARTAVPPPAPAPSSRPALRDDLFGAPAIRKSGSGDVQAVHPTPLSDAAAQRGHIEGNLAVAVAHEAVVEEPQPKRVILDDIRNQWEAFLEYARDQIPQLLFFAVRKVELLDLQRGELRVESADAFSFKQIEEHQRSLSALLSSFHGAKIALRVILKSEGRPTESEDSFTRFRRLVQQDPKLRLLVDLFGAELEY